MKRPSPDSVRSHQVSLDQQLEHLVGPLIDLQHALIAIELLYQRSLQIPCAAKNLERVGAHPLRRLCREKLGHGSLLKPRVSLFFQPPGMEIELSRCLDAGCHLRE